MPKFPGDKKIIREMFTDYNFDKDEGFVLVDKKTTYDTPKISDFNKLYKNMKSFMEKDDKEKITIFLDYIKLVNDEEFSFNTTYVTGEDPILNGVANLNNEKYNEESENYKKENDLKKEENNKIYNQICEKEKEDYKNIINKDPKKLRQKENIENCSYNIKKCIEESFCKYLNEIIDEIKSRYGLILTNKDGFPKPKIEFSYCFNSNGGGLYKSLWIKLKTPGDISFFTISIFLNKELNRAEGYSSSDGALYVCVELDDNNATSEEKKKLRILDSIFKDDKEIACIKLENRNRYCIPIFYRDRSNKDNKEKDILLDEKLSIKDKVCNAVKTMMKGYKEVLMLDPIAKIIQEQISAGHKQIILTGAPGTGKTYSALEYSKTNKDVTKEVYNFTQFHPSYDYTDFVEGIRPIQSKNGGNSEMTFVKMDGTFKAFCRFVSEKNIKNLEVKINNTELTLENKIQLLYILENNNFDPDNINNALEIYGLINKNINTNNSNNVSDEIEAVNFIRENNIHQFFNEYKANLDTYYCFVIDEINRADISKVFGELMFALEYRGIKNRKPTQYQNLVTFHKKDDSSEIVNYEAGEDCFSGGFFIPENVIIIGTMNDIDKSVESFDFAMRRRFRWPEIKVDEEFLKKTLTSILRKKYGDAVDGDNYKEQIGNLSKNINNMNKVIEREDFMGAGSYDIGPAYFNDYQFNTKNKNEINEESLKDIYDNRIKPILVEYTRGRGNTNKYETLYEDCKTQLTTK